MNLSKYLDGMSHNLDDGKPKDKKSFKIEFQTVWTQIRPDVLYVSVIIQMMQ